MSIGAPLRSGLLCLDTSPRPAVSYVLNPVTAGRANVTSRDRRYRAAKRRMGATSASGLRNAETLL
jgi:hypothetical protein